MGIKAHDPPINFTSVRVKPKKKTMPQLMKRFEAPFESHEISGMKNEVVCIPSEKKSSE